MRQHRFPPRAPATPHQPPPFTSSYFLRRRKAATPRLLMDALNECGLKYRLSICGRASSPPPPSPPLLLLSPTRPPSHHKAASLTPPPAINYSFANRGCAEITLSSPTSLPLEVNITILLLHLGDSRAPVHKTKNNPTALFPPLSRPPTPVPARLSGSNTDLPCSHPVVPVQRERRAFRRFTFSSEGVGGSPPGGERNPRACW